MSALASLSASSAFAQKPPALAARSSQPAAALQPKAFAAEIRGLEAKILGGNGTTKEILAILRTVPPSWKVATSERDYEISSAPLRDLLERASRNPAGARKILDEAGVWAENAATQAEAYSAASSRAASTDAGARARLTQILRGHEFAPAGPPSLWERWRRRVNDWLARIFAKLFRGMARHPLGSKMLFWFILFCVVCWLVTMLVRFWSGRGRNIVLRPISAVATHRSWQEWIRAAQESANRGEFRDAIHSLYWVGITRLEDLSILAPDHTRTPREQLRLLSESAGAQPSATPEQRARMAALTAQLERVWYGKRPAGIDDFRECLQQVEELGCRP